LHVVFSCQSLLIRPATAGNFEWILAFRCYLVLWTRRDNPAVSPYMQKASLVPLVTTRLKEPLCFQWFLAVEIVGAYTCGISLLFIACAMRWKWRQLRRSRHAPCAGKDRRFSSAGLDQSFTDAGEEFG